MGDEEIRVGDRVRWSEGYPADFSEQERNRLGTVVAVEAWGSTPMAEVEWFGWSMTDHVPRWQLEVVARAE